MNTLPAYQLALPPPRLTLADSVHDVMPDCPNWKSRVTTIDPNPFADACRLIESATAYERANYRESVSCWFDYRRRDFDWHEERRLRDLGIMDPDRAIDYAWKALAVRLLDWAKETAVNRSLNAERARIMRGLSKRRIAA